MSGQVGDGGRVPVEVDAVWPSDQDDVEEGVVSNWFFRESGTVDEGETMCEIQIEKVSIDVPAPASGTLAEIAKGEDDEFRRGDVLAWIEPG